MHIGHICCLCTCIYICMYLDTEQEFVMLTVKVLTKKSNIESVTYMSVHCEKLHIRDSYNA